MVAAFDHDARQAWVVATGYPERDKAARVRRAKSRLAWFAGLLSQTKVQSVPTPVPIHLAPTVERAQYVAAVRRAIEYIQAGDIYQANLSLPFEAALPVGFDPIAIYRRLREQQPAPFSAFLDVGMGQVLSLSMERFLSLSGGVVETRPIKGTRPRRPDPVEDARLRQELVDSEKDRAENVMIVDLLRNDLSRVCRPHTVSVPVLCAVESHSAVHHLVSVVRGELQSGKGPVDLLRATFPGGSITGAPKIRAMEIIAELETVPRGPYCGSIGYIGFDGTMDTSILIRTIVAGDGRLSLSAGAGIVADSNPEAEYDECVSKITGLLRALES